MKFTDRADALARRLERFFTGGAPNDPLYVTNRSVGQKVRLGLVIGAPLVVLTVFVGLAMTNFFEPRARPERAYAPPKEPTGEITGQILPHVDKDLPISNDYSRDVEVLEAAVSPTDHMLTGRIRNTTDRTVKVADLVFDVTDEEGSQLGGVSTRVENIPPHAIVGFKLKLEQRNARSSVVREVHSR